MRVVDTSAWIEWLADSPAGLAVGRHVPETGQMIMPTLVQFELAKWLLREAPEELDDVIAVTRECVVIPLSTEIALHAAELGRTYRLPAADSLIYATALSTESDLLTCDAHFEGLPNVIYVAKKAS